jgi:hypothetical protein
MRKSELNGKPAATPKKKISQLTEEDLLIQEEDNVEEEDNSFIVRSVLEGYNCISDLNITLGPWEILDLTTEDATLVRSSKDLRKALNSGLLERITRKEMEIIEALSIQKERAKIYQAEKRDQERSRVSTEVGDREFEAEEIDLYKANASHDEEPTTAGNANDPLTYATAFAAAKAEAVSRGKTLDAEAFSDMVKKNPTMIKSIISGNRGVTSGTTKRGRATVLRPPVNAGDDMYPDTVDMTNYNRDRYIAGGEDRFSSTDNGVAEEIDLSED